MRALCLGFALLSIACTDLECGEGTHQEGGVCLPNVLTRCGEGTVYDKGVCVVAEDVIVGDATDADVSGG